MSTEIKLIKETTDIKSLDMRYVDWDVVIDSKRFNVVKIEGYVHTIGDRYGDNDYWAYPDGEEPTYDNLVEFNGEPCLWDIRTESFNYPRVKWDECSIIHGGAISIYRNGEEFYRFGATDIATGLAHAVSLLNFKIYEHSLNFNSRHWKEEAIGRKVFFNNQPAIITGVNESGVYLEPDGIDHFDVPCYINKDDEEDKNIWIADYGHGLFVDFFSEKIYWHRD